MLIAKIAADLIETHYRLHGRWAEKPKRLLADLATWDAKATVLARAVLLHGPSLMRIAMLEQLAKHVLAPLGGLMPLEWSTEWEELHS